MSVAEDLGSLRFVAIVDGAAVPLEDARCATTDGAASCEAPLPGMAPGQHSIEVAAYVERDGERRESLPSNSLVVQFGGTGEQAIADSTSSRFATADGVELRATTAASGFNDAVALSPLPDGGLIVAERPGRIRIVQNGALVTEPALTLDDVAVGEGRGVLAVATAPDFERSRHIFLLYSATAGLTLARYELSGARLVARAVILEGLPASTSQPTAALAGGPDGKLYLALDDGGVPADAVDLGSYSGKVLRFNPDGTTPSDQPAASPILLAGLHRPKALTWNADARLWVVEADAGSGAQLSDIGRFERTARAEVQAHYALPEGLGTIGAAFFNHASIPAFRGNLFVSTESAEALLRVTFGDDGGVAGTEWLMYGSLGPVRAVTVSPAGQILALTQTSVLRIELAR